MRPKSHVDDAVRIAVAKKHQSSSRYAQTTERTVRRARTELIVDDESAYEDLAVKLATDPGRFAEVKGKVTMRLHG